MVNNKQQEHERVDVQRGCFLQCQLAPNVSQLITHLTDLTLSLCLSTNLAKMDEILGY